MDNTLSLSYKLPVKSNVDIHDQPWHQLGKIHCNKGPGNGS